MAKQKPLFMDFTWGAGGSSADLTLELSKTSQEKHGVMVNMHLTCTNQSKEVCDAGLAGAKAAGICNIVALRGDPPKGQERWEVTEGGFACALDLVKYMRASYGDYFSIQVRTPLLNTKGGRSSAWGGRTPLTKVRALSSSSQRTPSFSRLFCRAVWSGNGQGCSHHASAGRFISTH